MPWISFDLDGTLLDWPFGRAVFQRLRQEHATPELHEAFRLEYQTRFASDNPVAAFDWDDVHDAVTTRFHAPTMPRVLEFAADCHWDSAYLYSDTQKALEKLDARGWLLALGTNGLAKYQTYVLEQYEMEFPIILAPDTTGFVKPQAGFLHALITLTEDPDALEGLVHVGDLLSHDIACANNAGVRGAWIWRQMPAALQNIPILERTNHPEFVAAITTHWQAELLEHGAFSENEKEPKPDFIICTLLELLEVL